MPRDVTFRSGGETCAAWLYAPATDAPSPCVVMARGLPAYAERCADAGIAALVFEYRPGRDVRRHLDDWRAALACARSLDEVDPARVAAWGTSLSGGHVAWIAAEDPLLAAAVSQVPFMDGLRTLPLRLPLYRPIRRASRIACPWLVVVAERDGITPPEHAVAAAARAPRAELRSHDCGHFELYGGPVWERNVADQVAFLTRVLRPGYSGKVAVTR